MHQSSYYLTGPQFPDFDSNLESQESFIGQKAQGLLNLPKDLVPPFIVLNYRLYDLWLTDSKMAETLLRKAVVEIILQFDAHHVESFIIRSSAEDEAFDDRGHFESSIGNITKDDVYKTILSTWRQNHDALNAAHSRLALIIQQYVKPKLFGHLSNERRVSRNKTDWLIEAVNERGDLERSKKISNKSLGNKSDLKIKQYKASKDINSFFNSIIKCDFLNGRHHIEWVWDGQKIWLVQNDLEKETKSGSPPGSAWNRIKNITDEKPAFKVLKTIATTEKPWKKIECVKAFRECGLPYGEIFILEDALILTDLSHGNFSEDLIADLEWILKYPIVIRMDVEKSNEDNNILLPRTETLYTLEQTKEFIIRETQNFQTKNANYGSFCFLIHRFIISKAGALAFAVPNKPKARIDSTWGIVDGLYYHPHDSFEVSLTDNSIKKLIRCKNQYLDVDNKGKWLSKESGIDWDWAESLDKNQLIDITKHTTALANRVGSPVVVMYFVDINPNIGYPPILPWYFTTEEVTSEGEKSTDIIFSQQKETIRSKEDFDNLKKRLANPQSRNKVIIKINLNPDLLRDKSLIEEIGQWAKDYHFVIELEGSILAHTYYILRKIGATVKCVNIFEPKYEKQKFYKLVRDNIPVNIQSGGEKVKVARIASSELLEMLKEKAVEEAFEFYWESEDDKVVEEMADIYEILRSACKIFDITLDKLGSIADKKSEKKGGFDKGVFLIETTESPLIQIKEKAGEALFVEDSNEKLSGNISKIKRKAKVIDNSYEDIINIPYALSKPQPNSDSVKSMVMFGGNLIELIHLKKGIQMRIVKDKPQDNPAQLSLFATKSV